MWCHLTEDANGGIVTLDKVPLVDSGETMLDELVERRFFGRWTEDRPADRYAYMDA
jgi:hypothetical protein